jgi:hypothetical protein
MLHSGQMSIRYGELLIQSGGTGAQPHFRVARCARGCSRRVKGQKLVCEACTALHLCAGALELEKCSREHLADPPVRKPDDEVETWPGVAVPGGRRFIGHRAADLQRRRLTLGRSYQVPDAAWRRRLRTRFRKAVHAGSSVHQMGRMIVLQSIGALVALALVGYRYRMLLSSAQRHGGATSGTYFLISTHYLARIGARRSPQHTSDTPARQRPCLVNGNVSAEPPMHDGEASK